MPDFKAECETYLRAAGSYENRSRRYELVVRALVDCGWQQGDVLYDLGAGMCDFARYAYTHGMEMRYVPVDGSIDGTDLEEWSPPQDADWYVCIETIEHLRNPWILLSKMQRAKKGAVVTTPNPDRTDVLALDPDHKSPVYSLDFALYGYLPEAVSIHYQEDTLLATYQR